MSEAVLDAQASFVTTGATGQEASSERESLNDDDVERNTKLYIFNYEVGSALIFTKLAIYLSMSYEL